MLDTPAPPSISIIELSTKAEIRLSQSLRYQVWKAEGAHINFAASGVIADPHDDHAIHFGAFQGSNLIGTARICLHDSLNEAPDANMFSTVALPAPIASMNRLVLLDSHRGWGIGSQFDHIRITKAKELGARTVIVTPVNNDFRRASLSRRGFSFIDGIMGNPTWSPTVEICACYLVLDGANCERDGKLDVSKGS